jgi:hypothetical protein
MPWRCMGHWTYGSTYSWPPKWSASCPGHLTPVTIGWEAGWAPEIVWTTWTEQKSRPYRDANSDPSPVQPVASRYTDCSISTIEKRQRGKDLEGNRRGPIEKLFSYFGTQTVKNRNMSIIKTSSTTIKHIRHIQSEWNLPIKMQRMPIKIYWTNWTNI